MERLTYILDTNAIADYINQHESTTARINRAIHDGHILYLCQPVEYEVLRGLLKAQATQKKRIFEEQFASQIDWLPLTDDDWRQAARFWAETRSAGRQLSDVDLLVAALAKRLESVIVSSDDDFDALTAQRENRREPPEEREQFGLPEREG